MSIRTTSIAIINVKKDGQYLNETKNQPYSRDYSSVNMFTCGHHCSTLGLWRWITAVDCWNTFWPLFRFFKASRFGAFQWKIDGIAVMFKKELVMSTLIQNRFSKLDRFMVPKISELEICSLRWVDALGPLATRDGNGWQPRSIPLAGVGDIFLEILYGGAIGKELFNLQLSGHVTSEGDLGSERWLLCDVSRFPIVFDAFNRTVSGDGNGITKSL